MTRREEETRDRGEISSESVRTATRESERRNDDGPKGGMKGDSVTSPVGIRGLSSAREYLRRPRTAESRCARNKGAQRRLSSGEFLSFLGRRADFRGGDDDDDGESPPPSARVRSVPILAPLRDSGRRPEVTIRFGPVCLRSVLLSSCILRSCARQPGFAYSRRLPKNRTKARISRPIRRRTRGLLAALRDEASSLVTRHHFVHLYLGVYLRRVRHPPRGIIRSDARARPFNLSKHLTTRICGFAENLPAIEKIHPVACETLRKL